MITRLLGILAVAALLVSLIVYSQMRPEVRHVSGYIEADEIRLGSRVGGRVAQVHVEEGQRVEAGQLLVELQPYDLIQQQQEAKATLAAREAECQRLEAGLRKGEVAQAEARYQQLQARLDKLLAGPRKQEIDAARARVQGAESEQRLANANYRRVQRLVGTNAVSQEELDRAVEALQAATANAGVRQEELNLLESGTRPEEIREAQALVEEARLAWKIAEEGFRQEEIDQAQAARDAARAALEAVGERVAELKITSPIAGVVEALELQPGDLVPAGAPVLSILDDSHLWVRAYVPQDWISLKIDQRVSVTVDSYPGEQFAAEVSFIARQAEFTPSNVQTPEQRANQVFRVKVQLQEGLDKLRPGTSADVWLGAPGSETAASPGSKSSRVAEDATP
jgi:multidrug resistance efflux pump